MKGMYFNTRLPSKVTSLMGGFLTFILFLMLVTVFADHASAHGYIESPASRSYLCKQGKNTNCGAVQYEPQSIEAIGNFPTTGPKDGEITGGGIFKELFEQKSNRWTKETLQTGRNTFTWKLTAPHATDNWKYYITKTNWNKNKPVKRSDLELFCTVDNKGAKPNSTVSHQCTIPADHTGYHLILGVWDIADTPNAFYQVIDANIVKAGTTKAPAVPVSVKLASKTATSVKLKWTASTGAASYEIYRNGVLAGTSTTNSYSDQGLAAKTTYKYTVRAVNSAGVKSKDSSAIKVTTLAATGNSSNNSSNSSNSSSNNNMYQQWSATKAYLGGAKVKYGGATYQAKWWTLNETPGKSQVWKLISDSGQSTTVSTVPAWKANKAYLGGDKVLFNGVIYEAKWWTYNELPNKSGVWKQIK